MLTGHAERVIVCNTPTSFPRRVFVYLPHGKFELEHAVRAEYEATLAKYPAVWFGAIGTAGDLTLAAVWPIRELGQGEAMFIDHGVKVDVDAQQRQATITRSHLRWWLIRLAYRKWIERRDAALRNAWIHAEALRPSFGPTAELPTSSQARG